MKWIALVILLVAACRPAPALTPFAAVAPNTQLIHLRIDTSTPKPVFITWTPESSSTLPVFIVPTLAAPFPAATLTPTPVMPPPDQFPTWTPLPTWTIPPPDSSFSAAHFVFNYPVGGSGLRSFSRVYPYGGTYNGRLQVHHGVDLIHPLGTPLLAAADGVVIFAGNDFVTKFGPDNNYYGYLVVIQHNFLSAEGLPVYTLYGHMQQVTVQAGQVLRQGDVIGTVGESGVARGPHLHFEVRLGDPYDFGATRNPELWLQPFPNEGVLAGRVTDAYGSPVSGVTLTVQSNDMIRTTGTYVDASVNQDSALNENFTLGDLPPNYYSVSVRLNGQESFAQAVYVQPETMTWLDIVLVGG